MKPWGPQLLAATCQDSMLALTNGPPAEEMLSLSRCHGKWVVLPCSTHRNGEERKNKVISKVLQSFTHPKFRHFNNGNSKYFDQSIWGHGAERLQKGEVSYPTGCSQKDIFGTNHSCCNKLEMSSRRCADWLYSGITGD